MVERRVQTRALRSIDPASKNEQVRIIGFHFIYEKTADDEAETGTRVDRGMGQGEGTENLVEVLFCPVIVIAISFPALRERVVPHTYSRGAVLLAKQGVRRMIIAKRNPMVTKK